MKYTFADSQVEIHGRSFIYSVRVGDVIAPRKWAKGPPKKVVAIDPSTNTASLSTAAPGPSRNTTIRLSFLASNYVLPRRPQKRPEKRSERARAKTDGDVTLLAIRDLLQQLVDIWSQPKAGK